MSVHVRGPQARSAAVETAVEAAFDALRADDAMFSPWQPDSEVSRIRRGELALADAPARVRDVGALCDEAAERTGGAFVAWLPGPDGAPVFDPTGLVKGWAVEEAFEALVSRLAPLGEHDVLLSRRGRRRRRLRADRHPGLDGRRRGPARPQHAPAHGADAPGRGRDVRDGRARRAHPRPRDRPAGAPACSRRPSSGRTCCGPMSTRRPPSSAATPQPGGSRPCRASRASSSDRTARCGQCARRRKGRLRRRGEYRPALPPPLGTMPLKVVRSPADDDSMPVRPRHATTAVAPVLTWDAAVGAALLLVAAVVALGVPASDLTLRTVHDAPRPLPASSQPDGAHWWGGRQDP